jgi:hypothetical protein
MHISGLIVALVAAPLVAAGMYRAPVIELDAKSFKEVMSKEHASVSCLGMQTTYLVSSVGYRRRIWMGVGHILMKGMLTTLDGRLRRTMVSRAESPASLIPIA